MELDVGHPVLLGPGEGETVSERDERSVLIKVGLDAITATESRYERGERGPDAHIHRRHTDAFYVLEGVLRFELGPALDAFEAASGSFLAVPPGVVHTFRNERAERARFLNFHVPSEGFADYLRASRDGREVAAEEFDQFDPPSDGGSPLSEAVVHGPGEGETLTVASSTVTLKSTGDHTDGTFFLSETAVETGFPGPPPHVHERLHDLFYVLDGTLTLRVGDETVEGTPGTFACFPPGVVHTFSNQSGESVRFLNFNTPAGWENYMRDLAAALAGDRPPTPEEVGKIAARYDFEAVTP